MNNQMKVSKLISHSTFWFMVALLFLNCGRASAQSKPRVLIFCKTAGYHHASIPAGIAAIKKLGAENKFDVDTTTDSKNSPLKI
jgi:hypothetical protein